MAHGRDLAGSMTDRLPDEHDTARNEADPDGSADSTPRPVEVPPTPDYPAGWQRIRADLADRLGDPAKVESLFKQLYGGSRLLDTWWILWPVGALVATCALSGATESWTARLLLMAIAAWCIHTCGLVAHSICAHRQPFGPRITPLLGAVLGAIAFRSGATYRLAHLHHHKTVNTPDDQDAEFDLTRRWQRWLYATAIGYLLTEARVMAPRAARSAAWKPRRYYRRMLWARQDGRRRLVEEYAVVGVFWATIAALAWRWPEAVVFGYLVPLAVGAPVMNALRVAGEHSDVDLGNSYCPTTMYVPGRLVYLLAGHQFGVWHGLHHLDSRIPHYWLGRVWRLVSPFLEEHGTPARQSYLGVLRDYFVRAEPRTWYRDAEGRRVSVPSLLVFADRDEARRRRVAWTRDGSPRAKASGDPLASATPAA